MLEINDDQISSLKPYADSGVEEETQKQKYPALQLNQYKGLQPNSSLFWCFSEESHNLISDKFKLALKLEPKEAYFSDEGPDTVYKPSVDLRFIPLCIPKIYKMNKTTREISRLAKFQSGDRTIAKLFLIPLIDEEMLSEDDRPLILTLKLLSFKTDEIIGRTGNEDGTLKKLSSELLKRGLGDPGKSNVHFCNLRITPGTKMYKNKDGKSNRGANYSLESARLNTPDTMKIVKEILANEELRKDILDPFGLDSNLQGEIPEQEMRGVLKDEIFKAAQQLGWNKPRIKQEIQEVFGVPSSNELSIEQLIAIRDRIESLAKDYPDEMDAMPF